jgi:hypothetical protein
MNRILIDTPDEVIKSADAAAFVPRSAGGAVFNQDQAAEGAGRCDVCGRKLIIHDDDRPETIAYRQKQYWHICAAGRFLQRRDFGEVPGAGACGARQANSDFLRGKESGVAGLKAGVDSGDFDLNGLIKSKPKTRPEFTFKKWRRTCIQSAGWR